MKIGLLGHGVVGGGVTAITDSCAVKKVRRLEVTRILVKDESELTDPRCTLNVEEILGDPDIEVVAECMGGLEPAHTFVSRALEAGKHVVTSNKKMFAEFCEELLALAEENGVTIRYEAACGGGIPWMSNLTRTRRLEAVNSFKGIFNGTTNYILTRMDETGAGFAQCLEEAQKLGYAERNPTDDIEGYDVKYKAKLSALKAFDVLADLNEIPMYGISGISETDFAWAKDHGCSLKLMAAGENHGESISLWVMPVILPKNDLFATIPSNFNAMESDSSSLGKAVYVGQGAGSLPTAHAVVQDLLDIYQNQDSTFVPLVKKPVNNDSVKAQFYLHTSDPGAFHEIAKEISGNSVLTKEMTLTEMDRILKENQERVPFAAMVSA